MTTRSLLLAIALPATFGLSGCVDKNAGERPSRSSPAALTQATKATPPSRDFTCDTSAVTRETTLRPVIGAPGETLLLDPTGEPCRYHLLYKDAHGARERVLDEPALYAIAHAERFFPGTRSETTIVCASPIEHRKAKAPADRSNRANRTVVSVSLKCAVERGGKWSGGQDLDDDGNGEDGKAAYAKWVVGVTADPGRPDTFLVKWVRDSGFQYFNFSDAGRPPTDGVYQTTLTIRDEDEIETGGTIRLSTTVAAVTVKGK